MFKYKVYTYYEIKTGAYGIVVSSFEQQYPATSPFLLDTTFQMIITEIQKKKNCKFVDIVIRNQIITEVKEVE